MLATAYPASEEKGEEELVHAYPADDDEITVAEPIAAAESASFGDSEDEASFKGVPVAYVADDDDEDGGAFFDGGEAKGDVAAVRVDLEDLAPVVDMGGVRRRALGLRDAIFRDVAALDLRSDDALMTDVEAVILRDADREWTLLHHAANLGRARLVAQLLAFSRRHLEALSGPSATNAYCAAQDNQHNTALDLARQSHHAACASLLEKAAASEDDDDDDDENADSKDDDDGGRPAPQEKK